MGAELVLPPLKCNEVPLWCTFIFTKYYLIIISFLHHYYINYIILSYHYLIIIASSLHHYYVFYILYYHTVIKPLLHIITFALAILFILLQIHYYIITQLF